MLSLPKALPMSCPTLAAIEAYRTSPLSSLAIEPTKIS